jgi:XPA protein C-terminus
VFKNKKYLINFQYKNKNITMNELCIALKRDGRSCKYRAKYGKYCGIHKSQSSPNEPEHIPPQEHHIVHTYSEDILINLPSSLIGCVLSFDDNPLLRAIELCRVNHKWLGIVNIPDVFVLCIPKYMIKTFPKNISPLEGLRTWKDTHQICENLYCPILTERGDCCNDCCKQICKTIAKKCYSLTDKQLSKLPFTKTRNPHYSNAYPMILFNKCVIRKASLDIYGSWSSLEVYKKKREDVLDTRRRKIEERKNEQEQVLYEREKPRLSELSSMTPEQRRELIKEKLKQYGLEWRSDSILLPAFVKWDINPEMTDDHVISLLIMTRDFFNEYPSDDDDDMDYPWDIRESPNFTLYSSNMKRKMRIYMLKHEGITWIDAYEAVKFG